MNCKNGNVLFTHNETMDAQTDRHIEAHKWSPRCIQHLCQITTLYSIQFKDIHIHNSSRLPNKWPKIHPRWHMLWFLQMQTHPLNQYLKTVIFYGNWRVGITFIHYMEIQTQTALTLPVVTWRPVSMLTDLLS